jgi:hypothetical protein
MHALRTHLSRTAVKRGAYAALAALGWALHISLDRSLGYGMRTRDGFQRS